jgi:alkyldihydroxyacetonephosphate synthase
MSLTIDRASLLVRVPGAVTLAQVEEALSLEGLTLGLGANMHDTSISIADWIARGAPGAPSPFADPADHLLAGLTATLANGRHLDIRPAPRRAVGPDLIALVFGARERFATLDRAWLRVHLKDAPRARPAPVPAAAADAPLSAEESALVDAIVRELRQNTP